MFVFGSETEEDHAEERHKVIHRILDAMVASRHADVMDTYGMPRNFFSNREPEVLAPEESMMRPKRPMKVVPEPAVKTARQYSSVLRGDRRMRVREG